MKSMALYDSKGVFIGVMGKVRDITDEMGAEFSTPPPVAAASANGSGTTDSARVGMFDKLLGKAKTSYQEGLQLSYREGKYSEAIPYFDKAIQIDPNLAYVWHDRGVCYRELRNYTEALKNFDKAVELAPDDEEFLFSRAEMLKMIGILRQRRDLLESAVKDLNRIVEKNPNHADAWNSLGVCSQELGKEKLSRQYFEKSRDIIKQGKNKKKTRSFEAIT
jgi:tetratricopeptide (TPR) repeat protein